MYTHCLHNTHYSYYVVTYLYVLYTIVSGDANFSMPSTYLTVGGFTQSSMARHIVELPSSIKPSSIKKGFTHRFMWIFPKPLYQKFAQLRKVHKEFTENLSEFRYSLLCIHKVFYKGGSAIFLQYYVATSTAHCKI